MEIEIMSRAISSRDPAAAQPATSRHGDLQAAFSTRLAESARFHMAEGNVHRTLAALAEKFDGLGIEYAIIGAMALNAHGFARETTDVDVLITPAGLERFRELLLGRGYIEAFTGARKTFRDTRTGTKVEFITSGEYPGDGKPKPVVVPDPNSIAQRIGVACFASLPSLIELKLASGMTQPARRRDLADIQDLIRILGLSDSFANELHPYVRDMFLTLHRELQSDRSLEEPPP
jgi:hypothetical protein